MDFPRGGRSGGKGKTGGRNPKRALPCLRDGCQESGGLKVGGVGVGREVGQARARQGPRGKEGRASQRRVSQVQAGASGAAPPPPAMHAHSVFMTPEHASWCLGAACAA